MEYVIIYSLKIAFLLFLLFNIHTFTHVNKYCDFAICFYSQFRKTWRKVYECCDGYKLVYRDIFVPDVFANLKFCEPICQPDCGNGICVRPNVCSCNHGYRTEKTLASDVGCVPVCTHPCVHGKCVAPEICMCDSGYKLSDDYYTCEPICKVPCPTGSYCYKPDQCLCRDGYKMIISEVKLTNVGKQ